PRTASSSPRSLHDALPISGDCLEITAEAFGVLADRAQRSRHVRDDDAERRAVDDLPRFATGRRRRLGKGRRRQWRWGRWRRWWRDRKSTRLNSRHQIILYA